MQVLNDHWSIGVLLYKLTGLIYMYTCDIKYMVRVCQQAEKEILNSASKYFAIDAS